jgi:hypothetical protein
MLDGLDEMLKSIVGGELVQMFVLAITVEMEPVALPAVELSVSDDTSPTMIPEA